MDGLGALAASLLIGARARPGSHGRLFVGGALLYFLMQILLAASPYPWLAATAVAMTGVAAAGFGIMQTTLIYLAAPAEMRSRVFGVLTACIGVGPIGFIHLGLLADAIGAPWATALSGLEGLLVLLLLRRFWQPLLATR